MQESQGYCPPPREPSNSGPHSSSALQVQSHLEDAKAKGAQVLVGDSLPSMPAPYDKGYFHQAAVVVSALPLLLLAAVSRAESLVRDRSLSRALRMSLLRQPSGV